MNKKDVIVREGYLKGLREAQRIVEAVLSEAGYRGYSMSNNAVRAYSAGKKPLSRWNKTDILSAVEEVSDVPPERKEWLKKQPLSLLRSLLLMTREWHHTSSQYNRTDFYEVDEDKLTADEEDWQEYVAVAKEAQAPTTFPVPSGRRHGKFFWLTWTGTRQHPRPVSHECLDAFVEQKGAFYFVYDRDDNLVVKKKVGSNGTEFVED